jgi:hypothetical protein
MELKFIVRHSGILEISREMSREDVINSKILATEP